MVKGAFKRAYEAPTAENMAYLRLSMYVFAFDSIATYAAFRPLKPLVISAKTALTDALRKGLTQESLEAVKDGVVQLGRTAQTILADQTGGVLSRETYQRFIDAPKRLIMSLSLDEQTKKVVLENIADKTWISDKTVQIMFKDRLKDIEVWRTSFIKVADELGWDNATKAKYSEALLSLVDVSERAPYSKYGHNLRVLQYTEMVLEHMPDLPAKEKAKIKMAALIHDVGKAGVENKHLKKPGRLSAEEFISMKNHTGHGFDFVTKINEKFGGISEGEMKNIAEIAKYHHERYDAKGYFKLSANEVPLGSKIIAVADTFDSMVSDRVYQKGRATETVINTLIEEKGKQFEPEIVDTFLKAVKEKR